MFQLFIKCTNQGNNVLLLYDIFGRRILYSFHQIEIENTSLAVIMHTIFSFSQHNLHTYQ